MAKKFIIIGGGIAGLTTAIALNKIGIKATVFENSKEVKGIGAGLGLGANAMQAFKNLGIMDEIIAKGKVLSSFTIFDETGRPITKTNNEALNKRYGVNNFTIHRADLHEVLLYNLDPNSIVTGKKAIDVVQNKTTVTVKFEDGSFEETDFLIVADGIHSAIRQKLVPQSTPRYSGYTCWRAVIENPNLKLDQSSETWGSNGRFGIVPLGNNKVYWFACVNAPAKDKRYSAFKINDLLEQFKNYHEPIASVLKETKNSSLLHNDIIDLKPIHQYAFGNILLIGDSAHATTPNMAQGACQAIEDAVILADELKNEENAELAFIHFEERRMERTHFITNTSWKIGKLAQINKPALASLRNFVFRLIPESFNQKQLQKVFDVDF